jgi:hypothetical protein
MENDENKTFKNNRLIVGTVTENPRVGGSIPSRPTTIKH